MAKTEYSLENGLTTTVEAIIANEKFTELGPLRDQEVKVVPVMCVRLNKDDEAEPTKGKPVSVRKVTALEQVLFRESAHYLMTVDYATWNAASEIQQHALIFDALMDIDVDVGDDGVKLGKRKPDIVCHTATVRYFGAYSTDLTEMQEAFRSAKPRMVDYVRSIAQESDGEIPAQQAPEPAPQEDEEDPPRVVCGVPDDDAGSKPPKRGKKR
jgi:hypothetical protein